MSVRVLPPPTSTWWSPDLQCAGTVWGGGAFGRWLASSQMGFVGVQCSVMSDSLGSHGLQHARLPCPLLFPSLFIELVRLYIYPMLYCPLLLLPSIFPRTRVFSNESTFCIRWPKNWSFNFSVSPSNEYSELISFRIDWFHLLPVQGTLRSLL